MARNWESASINMQGGGFWARMEQVRDQIKRGSLHEASEMLMSLANELAPLGGDIATNRLRILETFAKTYRLNCKFPAIDSSRLEGTDLDDYVKVVTRGVSLVTCCKNRNENLLKALPSWLACTEISEIVIVDWSSDTSVEDELAEAGFADPRIKVIRVEDEPRWILTYAFNVGFRAARYDKILKVDADIVLDSAFFRKNSLEDGAFISGDWRIAEAGQEFINGFFYTYRADLMRIQGFNEFITTYGWDDDDIYHRLEVAGLTRARVDPTTIFHLPHDDAQRIGGNAAPPENAWDEYRSDTRFKIRANRFIANVMPVWGKNRSMIPYVIEASRVGFIKIRRKQVPIFKVPEHVRHHAEFYAASELLSWRLGPRVLHLGPERLDRLLSSKKRDQITKFDVELLLSGLPQDFRLANSYLLVKVQGLRDTDHEIVKAGKEIVSAYAERFGLSIIIVADVEEDRVVLDGLAPSIGSWAMRYAGAPITLTVTDLVDQTVPEIGQHGLFTIDKDAVSELYALHRQASRPVPHISPRKEKIFVDAQHGLGNRLRAIASGAVIAKQTGRELVIVWEPDHHCECRFHDLFDYQGPVIEQSQISVARRNGAIIHNYMEIEKGAAKDEPIRLDAGKDIYFRSAYVAKSDLADWSQENDFLRALTPSVEVLALVDKVRQSNNVGVHVRMEAGQGLDYNSYDSVENWTKEGHEQLHYWRAQSHYSRFMNRLDQLIQEQVADSVFLAADRPEIYKEFVLKYGHRIAYLERSVFDRSKEQIQYALADAILLSKCNRLLGSTWSSFSELALRLSPNFESIEMSGKEF